MKKSYFIKW